MHVTENVPHRPRTSACARPYFACTGLHNDFCESCRDLCIPTFRAKTGPVRLPCPTNAGRDSKKGCNFVTEGVRYANVCVRYVNTQQKSGTKGVIYEETNPQPGADAVPAGGAAALSDDGRRGGQPGGCRAVCERGICEKLRREDGHGPLYLPGAGLYRSVLPRVLGQLCGLCQPRVLHGVHLHGAVVPRHRRHARRARRLLAQRRPLRHALCHDAGGCCLQRRDVQQDLACRGHRALRRRRGQLQPADHPPQRLLGQWPLCHDHRSGLGHGVPCARPGGQDDLYHDAHQRQHRALLQGQRARHGGGAVLLSRPPLERLDGHRDGRRCREHGAHLLHLRQDGDGQDPGSLHRR